MGTTKGKKCAKRKKECPAQAISINTDGATDIFNSLPDSLIIEILSFLPLTDAIRTSFLSRRWRDLWKHVYNLEFEPSSCEWGLTKFTRFLGLYQGAKIRKFKAKFAYDDACWTNSWVNMALDRQVEQLVLSSSRSSPTLPQALLYSKSLVALTLTKFELELPASIHLHSLKILSLTSINLTSNLVKDLISNCPVLANLSFNECSMTEKLEISSESLHFKSLTVRNTGKGILIYAPHLEFLLLSGKLLKAGCFLINLSSLVEVHLHLDGVVSSCMSGNASEHFFFSVLKGILDEIHHVKRLHLCDWGTQVHSKGEMGTMPPQFINLTYLELGCNFTDVAELPGIANLLSQCPILETFVITLKKGVSFCAEHELWRLLGNVFSQLLTHLKTVKIHGFTDSVQEIACAVDQIEKVDEIFETYDSTFEFMRILLRCSKSVEKVTFIINNRIHISKQIQRRRLNGRRAVGLRHINYFCFKLEQKLQACCGSSLGNKVSITCS